MVHFDDGLLVSYVEARSMMLGYVEDNSLASSAEYISQINFATGRQDTGRSDYNIELVPRKMNSVSFSNLVICTRNGLEVRVTMSTRTISH